MKIPMTRRSFCLGLNIAVRYMNHCDLGEIAENYNIPADTAEKIMLSTLRAVGDYIAAEFRYDISTLTYWETTYMHNTLRDILNREAYESLRNPRESPFWRHLGITPRRDMPAELADCLFLAFHGAPCFDDDGKNYTTFSLTPHNNTLVQRYESAREEAEHLTERYTVTDLIEDGDEILLRCTHRENPRRVLFLTADSDEPTERFLTNAVSLTCPNYSYCDCAGELSRIYIPPDDIPPEN